MTGPKSLGEIIKEARKAKMLSQSALAVKVGISQPSLSAIEHGQNAARPATLSKLEAVLEVDLSAFLPGPRPMPPGPARATGKVSENPRITLRLPPSDFARLDVLRMLERKPYWQIIQAALEARWGNLGGEDKRLAEDLLKRALQREKGNK